jgi:hypothetical protein|tara:strand:+ start:271 stop:510 length:240 start_codon:yes stop_codon:yes gene_type:complete
MTLFTKGMGAVIKGLKTNKKTSGSYFITDPKPKVVIKDPDTIKLNKQLTTAKKVGAGIAGTIGASAVYGKAKKAFKEKD